MRPPTASTLLRSRASRSVRCSPARARAVCAPSATAAIFPTSAWCRKARPWALSPHSQSVSLVHSLPSVPSTSVVWHRISLPYPPSLPAMRVCSKSTSSAPSQPRKSAPKASLWKWSSAVLRKCAFLTPRPA